MKALYLSIASSRLRSQVMKEYRQRIATRYPVRSIAARMVNALLRLAFSRP